MTRTIAVTVDVNDVVRSTVVLANLPDAQRVGLFKELCRLAGKDLAPGLKVFSKLETRAEQAEILLQLLTDYDNATSGYICTGISLPVRGKNQAANSRQWQAFATKIEDELNVLQRAGYPNSQLLKFDEHGVLIMGFKPPPMPVMQGMPFPFQMAPQGMPEGNGSSGSSDPDAGGASTAHRLMNQLVMAGRARISGSMTPEAKKEEVKSIVKDVTRGCSAEDIRLVVEIIDRHVTLHKERGGCADKSCELVAFCAILRETLLERRELQLC